MDYDEISEMNRTIMVDLYPYGLADDTALGLVTHLFQFAEWVREEAARRNEHGLDGGAFTQSADALARPAYTTLCDAFEEWGDGPMFAHLILEHLAQRQVDAMHNAMAGFRYAVTRNSLDKPVQR